MSSGPAPHYCSQCNRYFNAVAGLKQHLQFSKAHRSKRVRGRTAAQSTEAASYQSAQWSTQSTSHLLTIAQSGGKYLGTYVDPGSQQSSSQNPHSSSNQQLRHQPLLTNSRGAFNCYICYEIYGGVFFSQEALKIHMQQHPSCLPCEIAFVTEQEFWTHWEQTHHGQYIGRRTQNFGDFTNHTTNLQPTGIQPYIHTSTVPCEVTVPFLDPLLHVSSSSGSVFDSAKQLVDQSKSLIHGDNTWTIVEQTPRNLEALQELCHSRDVLQKATYRVDAYTHEELNGLRQCKSCKIKLSFTIREERRECRFHPGHRERLTNGKLSSTFSCCNRHHKELPCQFRPHVFESISVPQAKYDLAPTPPPRPFGAPRRAAVALDCEMGGDASNQSVLIQLSAIDFFTGEVLISSIVKPATPLQTLRTRWSGVTRQMMDDALSSGNFLDGWVGARAKLWEFIDSETVLIGHALLYDLSVLHLIHPRIVDSALAIPQLQGCKMSLKALSLELLGKRVQMGKKGHDCLEDSYATRELVIWVLNHPEEIEERRKKADIQAEEKQKAETLKDAQKELKRLERLEKKRAADEEMESRMAPGEEDLDLTLPTGLQGASNAYQAEQRDLAQEGKEEKKERRGRRFGRTARREKREERLVAQLLTLNI